VYKVRVGIQHLGETAASLNPNTELVIEQVCTRVRLDTSVALVKRILMIC